MTELTQPLHGSVAEAPARTNATTPPPPSHHPSFTELVYAHFAWWHALREHATDEGVNSAYQDVFARFEDRYGSIVDSYWCSNIESAVALTEKRRSRWTGHEMTFHRETDWATKSDPDIAAQLHRCDDIAIRAKSVLNGIRQRICLQLVMSSAAHLLSLVDARAAHADESKTTEALAEETAVLDKTEKYYCEAANGQAQIVYFAGMASVAAVIFVVCGIWLAVDWAGPLAALGAGAVGAVTSVVQRINAGHFDLRYDVGRPYAFFLGGLRPLIGGSFALVIAFCFTSGILHLPLSASDPDANKRLALLVISFVAGFSERWAQDTLATALPVGTGTSSPRGGAKGSSG